ncbi:MAG TPA: PAS domain S-box protein [Pirellulales bacterium]|nr:PAS domain S-box protein [Pirellulales bacterium]
MNQSPEAYLATSAFQEQASILLVDDTAANLVALRSILESLGQRLVEAHSGEEAIELTKAEEFAAILLDVRMPGLNGFEAAKAIRRHEHSRATPIAFLTADDIDREQVEAGYALGAVDFFIKPLSPVVVRAKVAALVRLFQEKQRARNEAEQLRLLVQSTTDYAIFMLDPQGRIATWNPGAERLKGYKAAEIIGQHFSRFYPTEAIERRWPEHELKVAAAEGRFEDEGWRLRQDGSAFWANVVITALKDDQGRLRGFSKITRDLTARKQAEDDARRLAEEAAARRVVEQDARLIREQRERLQVTLASIGDAVISTDDQGRVEFLNPVAEQLLGWNTLDAAGRALDEIFRIVNENTRQPVENPARRALRDGQVVGLANHTILLSRDGTERPIDDSAAPIKDAEGFVIGCVLVFRDISERKRAEESLRQQREWLSVTLASIGDAVIATDSQGHVTYLNDVAQQLTGWARADAEGRPLGQVFNIRNEQTGQRVESPVEKVLRQGTIVGLGNHTVLVARDGTERPIDDSAAPIRDAAGKLIGVVLIFRDVTEQRRAEAALRESEENLRLLADTIPQLAWMARPDGHIIWYNRRWYEYTGTTAEEMEGWGWQSVHDPDVLPEVVERWKASIASGQPFDMVFPLRGADGRFRSFLTRVNPLKNADGTVLYWFGTNTDVTELREARQALAASEERFRQLADAMPQIVWTAKPDGNIDYLNRRWTEFTGLAQTVGNEGWTPIVHPDELQAANERWMASVETGEPFEAELRLFDRQRQSYRWHLIRTVPVHSESGGVNRWYGSSTDIHEQKRGEQTARFLADASAALAVLVDFDSTLQKVASLAVPYFADWATIDALEPDGTLRRVAVAHVDPAKVELAHEVYRRFPPNPSSQTGVGKILRTGASEIVPVITDELLARSVADEDLLSIMRRLGLKSYIGVPLTVRNKTLGVLTFIVAESGHVYDETDLSVAKDLANRTAIAIENSQLYRELRDADQRKDEFLATLAHELRNPLAPIRNGLQVLRLAGSNREMMGEARTMMERQLDQMVRLVDDLLDVSRITRNKLELRKERVALASVVHSAIETSRPLIEQFGHTFSVTIAPAPVYLDADPVRLAQVLSNLLNNSAKYTEPGGKIFLTAETEGNEAVIKVRDTGFGIPAEALPRIFEMFSQVDRTMDRAQGGLGIGLTLVRRLTEMHGGRVEARSEGPGRGSEFVVRLPVADAPQRHSSDRAPDGPGGEAGPHRRILVVDDNRDSASSLGMMLKLMGNEVRTAHDGLAALEAAEHFRPDFILLDIGLPKLNGYETCRRIRAEGWSRNMVIVALTGWGQEEDRRRSQEAGFDHHLVKPVDIAVLRILMEQKKSTA